MEARHCLGNEQAETRGAEESHESHFHLIFTGMEPATASAGPAGADVSLLEEVYLAASLATYFILQSVFRLPP